MLLDQLAEANALERASGAGIGPFGAVVGATRTAGSLELVALDGPYLVPGVGAQGATPADVGALFRDVPRGSVLVNASRSILATGPDRAAIRGAAESLAQELAEELR